MPECTDGPVEPGPGGSARQSLSLPPSFLHSLDISRSHQHATYPTCRFLRASERQSRRSSLPFWVLLHSPSPSCPAVVPQLPASVLLRPNTLPWFSRQPSCLALASPSLRDLGNFLPPVSLLENKEADKVQPIKQPTRSGFHHLTSRLLSAGGLLGGPRAREGLVKPVPAGALARCTVLQAEEH